MQYYGRGLGSVGEAPREDAEQWVRATFHNYLGRHGDAAGIAFWTGVLNNNTQAMGWDAALAELRRAFTTSGEYTERQAFDENYYLNLYPDVRAAVNAGSLKSAWEHYFLYGKAQGLQARARQTAPAAGGVGAGAGSGTGAGTGATPVLGGGGGIFDLLLTPGPLGIPWAGYAVVALFLFGGKK